jgi:peptidoglycan/xylan/chitin deacetylase (PgdA/CDA1 family)
MKPLASLSLDLDNRWSYLKTRGVAYWREFPSYLDVLVPRVLKFLAARKLIISVFVVGQDAAFPQNRDLLASIAGAGHEIGNHSFHHEPWLQAYSPAQIEDELASADEHIERATGRRPTGFRGPGFTVSPDVLDVLARRGYRYDASTLPTFLGPLARLYYFFSSSLTEADRQQRQALFGNLRDGLRPIRPYRWRLAQGDLLEIPVTTMPFLRVPFHASYVLYLASYSRAAALAYFRSALALCRARHVEPSVLLHPLDFLGADDGLADLAFFPGMNMPRQVKLEVLDRVLSLLTEHFEVVSMEGHARALAARAHLDSRSPDALVARPQV